jgi:hypothetical protein
MQPHRNEIKNKMFNLIELIFFLVIEMKRVVKVDVLKRKNFLEILDRWIF